MTRRPAARLLLNGVLLLLLLTGSTAPASAQETPAPDRDRPDTLTVMTYNVLYATHDTSTIRAIEAADPDLVGLQEISEPRLRYIARELGYYFHHHGAHEASGKNDTGILSRYPIAQATRYGATIYLTVDDPIHIANVHLAPYPYEPYQLRDDEITPGEAVAQARYTRYPEIQPVLEALQGPVEKGVPVVLTGDFNEPSHLDWTAEAAEAGLHMGMEVEWPISREIVRHGFRDAFRTVHPDEVEHPGATWTTLTGDPDEVHDRIDMVYVAGDRVEVLDAYTMGARPEPPTDEAVSGYPSDHRSVVVTIGLGPSGDDSAE